MKSLLKSDLTGVEHPTNIKYVRYVRAFLRLLGSWPTRTLGEETTIFTTLWSYYNLFLSGLANVLVLAFEKKHIKIWSFYQMGEPYIDTFLGVVYFTRKILSLTTKYENELGLFFNEVHLFHHKDMSDYAMKMHLYIHKVSHLFTVCNIGVMIWGYFLYNVIPLYNNYVGGGYGSNMPANFSYEYAVFFEVPFDYERNLKNHIFLTLFNIYTGVTCSTSVCVNDLLLALQMFHLWGHIKILIYHLENFPKPLSHSEGSHKTDDHYTDEELKDVSLRLKGIVEHHKLILRTIRDISDTFGLTIGIYYGFHLISNCILLCEVSTLDPKTWIRYGPLTLIIFITQIQISAVFELLSSMTDKLMRAAYSLPWEYMDVPNRRTVLIILARAQEPLGLKAAGMIEIGMRTTISVFKTTFSYYMMLRTLE